MDRGIIMAAIPTAAESAAASTQITYVRIRLWTRSASPMRASSPKAPANAPTDWMSPIWLFVHPAWVQYPAESSPAASAAAAPVTNMERVRQ